ncbi:hypothetical protein NL676_015537 [Syzygium grande]|nr:hypothetical protein NL676_015537 [Syzygium grande]
MEHMVKVPPPPGAMSTGYGGWSHPPPSLSSGQASSEFSGPHGPPLPPPPPCFALGFTQCTFTYDELAAATGGFSQANLLGQGGYGYVHKGVLPNGKEIAVKSLKNGSGQGDREFQAEVEIISHVHHRHLVALVGYCISESQRVLIYEFVPNNTLEYHLHGKDRPVMDWPMRLRIALGAARGLAYLHEDCHPKIIHRDIKAANILLDFNFEAKVSDFGLAKLSTDNHTHVSTRVMGTFGYLAPEYAASGKLTEKSDVFSFGVMLLELITGKHPVNTDMDDSLVDWATPIITTALAEGDYSELVDPRLQDNYVPQEMARMVACAGACIRRSSKRRPRMSQIVRALEGDVSLDEVHEWAKPSNSSTFGGGSTEAGSYILDMKMLRESALKGEVDVSSDYGYNPSNSSTGSNSREMSRKENF